MGWGCDSAVECLPSTQETLDPTPSTVKITTTTRILILKCVVYHSSQSVLVLSSCPMKTDRPPLRFVGLLYSVTNKMEIVQLLQKPELSKKVLKHRLPRSGSQILLVWNGTAILEGNLITCKCSSYLWPSNPLQGIISRKSETHTKMTKLPS
jgi:hypothetical protein